MHYRHGRKEQPAACRLEKTPGGCDLIKKQTNAVWKGGGGGAAPPSNASLALSEATKKKESRTRLLPKRTSPRWKPDIAVPLQLRLRLGRAGPHHSPPPMIFLDHCRNDWESFVSAEVSVPDKARGRWSCSGDAGNTSEITWSTSSVSSASATT